MFKTAKPFENAICPFATFTLTFRALGINSDVGVCGVIKLFVVPESEIAESCLFFEGELGNDAKLQVSGSMCNDVLNLSLSRSSSQLRSTGNQNPFSS